MSKPTIAYLGLRQRARKRLRRNRDYTKNVTSIKHRALQPSTIYDCYQQLSQPEQESCVNTARQPSRMINSRYPKRYTDSLGILNIHPLTYQQGRRKYVLPTYQHSRPTSESLSLKRPDICHSGARVAHLLPPAKIIMKRMRLPTVCPLTHRF